jgi:hypothetical protein
MAKFRANDPEWIYFERELKHTPVGDLYKRASLIMRIAFLKITLLKHDATQCVIPQSQAKQGMQEWRNIYAHWSNQASMALDELTGAHNWPPESAVDKSFSWQPATNRGRAGSGL